MNGVEAYSTVSNHQQKGLPSERNNLSNYLLKKYSLRFRNSRARKNEKKKSFLKIWLIMISIIIALFVFTAFAIDIYLLVYSTTKTTTTIGEFHFSLVEYYKSEFYSSCMRNKLYCFLARTSLLRWNSTGITLAGIGGSRGVASNQLDTPSDIALDSSNALYIADFNNHRIQKWMVGSSNGITIAGSANGTSGITLADLRGPTGVLLDSSNNLYVSDSNNNRVLFWVCGWVVRDKNRRNR